MNPRLMTHIMAGRLGISTREAGMLQRAAELLGRGMARLRAEWVQRIRSGSVPWAPLSQKTLADKKYKKESTKPLVGTGKMLRDMERWEIRTDVFRVRDGFEVRADLKTKPESMALSEPAHPWAIVQDMFFGRKDFNIPARPLPDLPAARQQIDQQLRTSMVSRRSNVPLSQGGSVVNLQVRK